MPGAVVLVAGVTEAGDEPRRVLHLGCLRGFRQRCDSAAGGFGGEEEKATTGRIRVGDRGGKGENGRRRGWNRDDAQHLVRSEKRSTLPCHRRPPRHSVGG